MLQATFSSKDTILNIYIYKRLTQQGFCVNQDHMSAMIHFLDKNNSGGRVDAGRSFAPLLSVNSRILGSELVPPFPCCSLQDSAW